MYNRQGVLCEQLCSALGLTYCIACDPQTCTIYKDGMTRMVRMREARAETIKLTIRKETIQTLAGIIYCDTR